MDRAKLEARLVELREDYDKQRLNLAAIDGAIQQCEWTLENWSKPLKAVKEAADGA